MRENAFSIPVNIFKPSSCEMIFFSLIYVFGLLLSFPRLIMNFCHFYILEFILIERKRLSQVLQSSLFGIKFNV